MVFCSVTVRVGDWPAPTRGVRARAMAAHQSRRTLEPVIEPSRETQSFAGSHRLRDVHAESTPIDAQSSIDEPVVEAWDPPGWQAVGTVAHEPRLARVHEDHDVEAFEPEEPRGSVPFLAIGPVVFRRVIAPIARHVAS